MKVPEFRAIPAHLIYLTFGFNQPVNSNSKQLEQGKLKLTIGNSNLLFQATSGLPGFQTLESSIQKGKGRIPTCNQAKVTSYFVSTEPVFLPRVKGVNGNFYPISPYAVKVAGFTRSDLGVHQDANVPGSSGCIVIPLYSHWIAFQEQMAALRSKGLTRIPLIVN